MDYKMKTVHEFFDEEARPFDYVGVAPFTSEMWWVDILMEQDQNFETDEWAEEYFLKYNYVPRGFLDFQIYIESEYLKYLAKEDLRFIYQDSTGMRKDEENASYEPNETKKPVYSIFAMVSVSLPSHSQDITWFSFHIFNKNKAGRVDMRWDFRKD